LRVSPTFAFAVVVVCIRVPIIVVFASPLIIVDALAAAWVLGLRFVGFSFVRLLIVPASLLVGSFSAVFALLLVLFLLLLRVWFSALSYSRLRLR